MKREFIVNGFNCQAVLSRERLDVTVYIPAFPITSKTTFRPLTPLGSRRQLFDSEYPEIIANQTITHCRSLWDSTVNQ